MHSYQRWGAVTLVARLLIWHCLGRAPGGSAPHQLDEVPRDIPFDWLEALSRFKTLLGKPSLVGQRLAEF